MRALLPFVLISLSGWGCAGEREGHVPLSRTHTSASEAGEAVLRAIRADAVDSLLALKVTREEMERHLYPEWPEARGNVPFEFVWGVHIPRSRRAARRTMENIGGLDLELVDIEFTEPEEEYPSFTLHRGAVMTVRRRPGGELARLKVMDVLVEWDGRWKMVNVDDD